MKVQFTYDVSYQQASQMVINRLTQLGTCPTARSRCMSPTSPIGEIFRYRVVGPPGYTVTDLKTIQDWILQRRFKAMPGVIDVTGWGGKSKTYDITVDLDRLLAYGLTLKQVLDALNNANINVGANTVNHRPAVGDRCASVGQIRPMDDIRNTMLTVRDGTPVLVSDVATVTVGNQPRLGIAGQNDDDDIVQGIVLMRRGAETLPTLRGVRPEVDKINHSGILPPGVRIERIYDRSALVDITTHTVLHNMVMGVMLIFLIQWLFLGDLRSALIVSATIPFALLFAVVVLVLSGESANLLSMGAIDFGIIVDATVIMVENIYRHLAESERRPRRRPTPPTPARPHRQAGDDLSRLGRGHAGDLLLGHHHHRGLPAAVHPVGRRGPHLRPDGADLCLCAVGRPARHLHRLARAGRPAAAGEGVGDRDDRRARWLRRFYRAGHRPRAARGAASRWRRRRRSWRCSPSSPAARSGWNSCPSSRKATCGSAAALPASISLDEPATTTPTACAG